MSNTPNTEQEISLLQVLVGTIKFVMRYYRLLAIGTVVGAVLGLGYYFIQPTVYKSSILGFSSMLSDTRMRDLVEDLNKLNRENNHKQVAKLLNIKPKEAKEIVKFQLALNVELDKEKDEFTASQGNMFSLTVYTYDQKLFEVVKHGFIYYIDNSDFVKLIRTQNARERLARTAILKQEMAQLDSLRKSIDRELLSGKAKTGLTLITDVPSISSRILELHKELMRTQTEDAVEVHDIKVIKDFQLFKRPAAPRISETILPGAILGFVAALLFVFGSIIKPYLKDEQ